ncbi:hypothetical protein BGLT_02002 [Caballeronia glathei]|jgi:hypothetical protein|uniref:Uncharacterized protein n=1 Tax=Caballeronia glathei TaxID=60547 RepID=A0A069PTQ7_9BURK|nr:hypothetical protein BG61_40265 [Caballeronia glathei]TCK39576.1 hypothetical protein B0G84_4916 [Paraburkholderia sp. BL8N3]CDY79306.1 hypothetical protein BGLT_02002 [Caballeronia glathei]
MERIDSYKGFEVTVTLESVRAVSSEFTYGPPVGYVAVVSICTADPKRPIGVPIRLVTEGNRVFGTEDEGLTAGFKAAQRVIDDKVGP